MMRLSGRSCDLQKMATAVRYAERHVVHNHLPDRRLETPRRYFSGKCLPLPRKSQGKSGQAIQDAGFKG
jgi:hypothetical protein